MIRHKRLSALTVLAFGGAVALIPATASSASNATAKKVVKIDKVVDDYYSLTKVTLKPGSEIKWEWSRMNYDSHNVTLIKGPKGISAREWTSKTGTSGITFNKTFTKPGTYHFRCTIHPDSMNMTVVVK